MSSTASKISASASVPTRLNSNKGTKSDMEVCPSPYSPRDYAYVASPNYRHHSSSQFWELDSHWIPHGCRGDMLPQHHRAVGDYLQERPYCPESPLANGSGQKFIARGYHTTGADLCTTSSKKHELNLSKARSAGAISYVAFRTFVGI